MVDCQHCVGIDGDCYLLSFLLHSVAFILVDVILPTVCFCLTSHYVDVWLFPICMKLPVCSH